MKRFALALTLALFTVSQVQAHFVWLAIESSESGKPTAKVYFAELAETDDAALLDKIAHVQIRAHGADGKASTQPLKLTKQVDKDGGGSWVAEVPEGTTALSGTIEYGVLERRGEVFQLNYHGTYADSSSPDFGKNALDASLPMQVLPYLAGEKSQVEVLWKGKPLAESEVVVVDAGGKEHDAVKTDGSGRVTVDLSKPGLYSIRAKWVEDKQGEHEGKKFEKANHYSTLTLRVK